MEVAQAFAWRAKPATLQADIYALGVILYQMVVGDLSRALAAGWRRDVTDDQWVASQPVVAASELGGGLGAQGSPFVAQENPRMLRFFGPALIVACIFPRLAAGQLDRGATGSVVDDEDRPAAEEPLHERARIVGTISGLRPGEANRLVLEIMASGLLVPRYTGLVDPQGRYRVTE